jgi:hypothetical protein
MTSRRHIFDVGMRVRVKKGYSSGSSNFSPGETLVFDSDGYSYYDNCFVYQFRSETDGQEKAWFLHEDQPTELWKTYFELLE